MGKLLINSIRKDIFMEQLTILANLFYVLFFKSPGYAVTVKAFTKIQNYIIKFIAKQILN